MLTVFCFYTNDFLYRKHADILKLSAEKFNINIRLYEYDKDNWQAIIQSKPAFIAKVRKELTGPLLYIDADAIILEDIQEYFLNIEEDIGIHYLDNKELLSGTIFINDTEKARSLIEVWENEMIRNPNVWDQVILDKVIKERVKNKKIKIKKIPEEYTYIFDCGNKILEPKIEHFQASREAEWIKRYKSKNFLSKFLYKKSKSTGNILSRHIAINQRTENLEIDIQFNFPELLRNL